MKDCHGYEDEDLLTDGYLRGEVLDLTHTAKTGERFYPIQFNNALRTKEFDGPTTTESDVVGARLMYPWVQEHDICGLYVCNPDGCMEHLCELWGRDNILALLLQMEETP